MKERLEKKGKKKQKKSGGLSGEQMRKRSFAVILCFSLLLTYLCGRVGYIQLVKGAEYQRMAVKQQTKTQTITAKRGMIYDRNGTVLALSVALFQVCINPREIRKDENHKNDMAEYQINIARKLSEILELDYKTVYDKVMKENAYQEIKRKVEEETINKLNQWIKDEKIHGVHIEEDAKRYYPNNSLAAHIIGFTGVNDQGVSGIESVYDEYLTGKNGYVLTEVDAARQALPLADEVRVDPENGKNIILTIDETIQHLVEKSLEKEIENCNVTEGAACIVMDPKTGEILALASNPTFDLNAPFDFPIGIDYEKYGLDENKWIGRSSEEDVKVLNETVWRNKAISDSYEPGSTFKSISAAVFLEEKIVTKDTKVSDTPLQLSGWENPISCWAKPSNHGTEPFYKAVHNSCNPVFANLALQLGIEKYYRYVDAFGFYTKTGLKFPGEANSLIHSEPIEINLATAAFGQRFQISPIQLATAYCAIANGGELLVPQLVKEITDSDGNIIEKFEKDVVRQVVSTETCKTVVDMLQGVVSEGTGSNAYVKGLRIAGKTGTSETITTEIDGRYIVSFCGIAPADNPEIVCLYILDHPNVSTNSGGALAAPAAGKLMEEILNYLKIERIYSSKDDTEIKKTTAVPVLEGKSVASAKASLLSRVLDIKIVGDDSDEAVIALQKPAAGFLIPEGSTVVVYTSKDEEEQKTNVPDLTNLTVNGAFDKLKEANLCMKLYGKGKVVSQEPKPGTKVPIGTIVTVEFRLFNDGAE